MKKRKKLIFRILLVLVLLVCGFFTKSFTTFEREKVKLKPAKKSASVEPTEVLSTKLIGPMRAFANISIWSRARDYEDEGEYFELVSLYSLAQKLQPRNPEVYNYLSNLLINTISKKFTNEESRWSSVQRGVDILEEGLAKLPASAYLHWNYALFYQNVTGRMPKQMIELELDRKTSLFNMNPDWRKQAEEILENIKNLDEEESFRFSNFCRDYGHTIIYGSKFKENPVYMTLSEKLRNLIISVNNTRVRLSYLRYLRSIGEIGYNPMLVRYMMLRVFETCAINPDDINPVYIDIKGIFQDILSMNEEKQIEFLPAINDFNDFKHIFLNR